MIMTYRSKIFDSFSESFFHRNTIPYWQKHLEKVLKIAADWIESKIQFYFDAEFTSPTQKNLQIEFRYMFGVLSF